MGDVTDRHREKARQVLRSEFGMVFTNEVDSLAAAFAEFERPWVEAFQQAAGQLQTVTDRLSAACRRDWPHDHALLRELHAVAKVLDAALRGVSSVGREGADEPEEKP